MAKFVAVIPARCGSERFPGKNLYPLCGKPLIAYPIEAASMVSGISRVIVSTDCEEVAEVAKSFGAEAPFLRPSSLAEPNSQVVDAVLHAVRWLEEQENFSSDFTILLQPTTPVISKVHIESAISLIETKGSVDSVITVAKVDTTSNPYNVRVKNSKGFLGFWQDKAHYQKNLREYDAFYKAANMWVTSKETLMTRQKLEGIRNYCIEVAWEYALDIDYIEDLELVEAWLEYKYKKGIVSDL